MKRFLFALVFGAAFVHAGAKQHIHRLVDKKNCASYKWLNVLSKSPAKCSEIIQNSTQCSQEYFSYASHSDGNCGCMTNTSVDCLNATNQLDDSSAAIYEIIPQQPHFHKLHDHQNCVSYKWLNVLSQSASSCLSVVLEDDNGCSDDFFVHAGNLDGNCACMMDSSIDCRRKENQLHDHNVTLYHIHESKGRRSARGQKWAHGMRSAHGKNLAHGKKWAHAMKSAHGKKLAHGKKVAPSKLAQLAQLAHGKKWAHGKKSAPGKKVARGMKSAHGMKSGHGVKSAHSMSSVDGRNVGPQWAHSGSKSAHSRPAAAHGNGGVFVI